MIQTGDEIYLSGEGATPTGDKPFLDRFNLATGKAERLFQSGSQYEEIVAMLDDQRRAPADQARKPDRPAELLHPHRPGPRKP